METKAGDPGAFAQFDLDRVSSPAFVVDAAKLRANCQVLANSGTYGFAPRLYVLTLRPHLVHSEWRESERAHISSETHLGSLARLITGAQKVL